MFRHCLGDIAQRLAPIVMLDSADPLLFTDVAVTVLRPGESSPSTGHMIQGPGDAVIEYALWVDMDIGHAYELEHVWVFADLRGNVVEVRGSAHGAVRMMSTPAAGNRPVVYSEPGRHGMASAPSDYAISSQLIDTLCTAAAGTMGVHRPRRGGKLACTVTEYRQAWNRLRALRFVPSWDAALRLDTRDLTWWTWQQLDTQRGPRAVAAVAGAPGEPVGLDVGIWGGLEEAWIGRSEFAGAELLLAGLPIEEAFASAQQHRRVVVAVADGVTAADAVAKSAWDFSASAHTFIACPRPARVDGPASLTAPAAHRGGTAQLVVSEAPREDFLTLGPGGDLDCHMELLTSHGWPERTGPPEIRGPCTA